MRIHAPLLSLLALGIAGAPRIGRAQNAAPTDRPALVVLIAVDQLRGDYLDRFGSQLNGGLARFRTRAAFFPHAWQDHSNTETAPERVSAERLKR